MYVNHCIPIYCVFRRNAHDFQHRYEFLHDLQNTTCSTKDNFHKLHIVLLAVLTPWVRRMHDFCAPWCHLPVQYMYLWCCILINVQIAWVNSNNLSNNHWPGLEGLGKQMPLFKPTSYGLITVWCVACIIILVLCIRLFSQLSERTSLSNDCKPSDHLEWQEECFNGQ